MPATKTTITLAIMAIFVSASLLQAADKPAPAPYADWMCVGGDCGMTKYCR